MEMMNSLPLLLPLLRTHPHRRLLPHRLRQRQREVEFAATPRRLQTEECRMGNDGRKRAKVMTSAAFG
jgi:hypothetical protein